ncbi:MAG: hypothetical protein ACE363_11695 [Alphaproteobacteria bacterium]
MTAYELADLYRSLHFDLGENTIRWTYVLFAFLIAGYAVGPRLNTLLAGILVGIFTMFSAVSIYTIAASMVELARLGADIRSAVDSGDTTLSWHGSLALSRSGVVAVMTWFYPLMLFLAYVGGLVFFFVSKRRVVE